MWKFLNLDLRKPNSPMKKKYNLQVGETKILKPTLSKSKQLITDQHKKQRENK